MKKQPSAVPGTGRPAPAPIGPSLGWAHPILPCQRPFSQPHSGMQAGWEVSTHTHTHTGLLAGRQLSRDAGVLASVGAV